MMIENTWWFVGGLLCAFTALLHLLAGQRTVVNPFLEVYMSKEVKGVLFACWHMVTVTLFISALVFLWGGLQSIDNLLVIVISVQFVLFAMGFIAVSRYLYPDKYWFVLPQWTLLLPIGLLGLAGSLW